MKKVFIMSLLTLTSIAMQAQEQKNVRVRAISSVIMCPSPEPTVDKKTKLQTIEWPSTENNTWHENIGIIDNVPIEKDMKSFTIAKAAMKEENYTSISWKLADEGDNSVLHCYFLMKADIVENLWLGNAESTILDKATGTIYQARSTFPECCYDKVFGVKGKKGTLLDLQIIFPRLPDTARDLAIYGVPNWFMRGNDVKQNAIMPDGENMTAYDQVPQFHIAHMVKDSLRYNKDDYKSWAVYNDPHLIKPVKEKTMALWRTPDATYLAIATEQNWIREYHGRGGNTILLDQQGHQYKCKGVMGYPNDRIFWLEGYPGDYFSMVLIFEPLPLNAENFTYVVPEGEPFNMWGANWSGEVIPNLEVQQLRKNQQLFEYYPRVVVK